MSSRSRFVLPVLLVLVALICVRLGVWQAHRLSQRRAANRAAIAARSAPVVELVRAPARAGDPPLANRRVHAVGRFDRSHELVLRGATLDEAPGVLVVTPLLLPGGGAVLVKRGFVPAADAVTAELGGLDEPGVVSVAGVALPIESQRRGGAPLTRGAQTTWGRLDLAQLRTRIPYPMLDVFVLQAPDSTLPRFPRRLAAPPLDDGPHLSYAIQWFAFAITALVVAGILAFRSMGPPPDHPAGR